MQVHVSTVFRVCDLLGRNVLVSLDQDFCLSVNHHTYLSAYLLLQFKCAMTPYYQKVLAPAAASSPATLPATSPAAEQYLFAGAGAGVAATNTVPDSPQRHALVLISATDPSIAVLAPTAVPVQASSSTVSKRKAKKQKDAKKHVYERLLTTVFTPALEKECRQRNLGVRNVHVNIATISPRLNLLDMS